MKICFVLGRYARRPIGGYKIVYEYANRLARRSHEISIVFINENIFIEHKVPSFLKKFLSNVMTQVEPKWFSLDRSIKKISANENGFHEKIKDVDICIATGVETVEFCEREFTNKKKAYIIQDFETWVTDERNIYQTYKKGYINIVISEWLENLVDLQAKEKSILIKNPIDLSVYKNIVNINDRKKHTIGFLYHKGEHKGVRYTIEAIKILQKLYSDLEVYAFGTSEIKEEIPGLVKYVRDASQMETVDIYNKVVVFLCSSINEGYGLTGMEAMACGAVLVSSDYKGIHEYGIDGYNCLLSPVKDVNKMVDNVIKIFENADLKTNLSQNGQKSLLGYDWNVAVEKFENAIN